MSAMLSRGLIYILITPLSMDVIGRFITLLSVAVIAPLSM